MTKPISQSVPVQERYHVYHADAHILSGELEHPIEQPIEHYGNVVLEKTRRESLRTESVGETSVEGLLSFKAGHTRVSGSELKDKRDIWGQDHSGWVTQSTAVLEGLSVGDVITADRVVAQVSTEHSLVSGHVPKVTFLGTRFENLRIAGCPVQLELDLGFCGTKPEGDVPYLADSGFLDRVRSQLNGSSDVGALPEALKKQYDAKIACIDDLRERSKRSPKGETLGDSKLQCSLIKSIGPISIPGVRVFGNTIFIPDFGTVSLAEVEVGVRPVDGVSSKKSGDGSEPAQSSSNYFTLRMLNMHLGCPMTGSVVAGATTANGHTKP